MNTIIPVILSSDNNYASYLDVTLVSILCNGKKDTFYDVYILVAPDFSENNKKKILQDAQKYKNNKINFVEMGNTFSNLKRMISHISNPTYYRLKAADILPSQYDKCIYFDVDIAVNVDLQEHFETNLEDNYIAGVKAAGYHMHSDGNQWYCNILGIPNINSYINAGAVIMNLKKIREDGLTKVFNEVAQNNYPTVDQDVINKVCFGRIKILPPKYNVMTTRIMEKKGKLLKVYTGEEIDEARTKPAIIHYADKIKPWQKPTILFAHTWWKYALKTCYFKSMFFDLLMLNFKQIEKKYSRIKIFLNSI